MARPSFADFDSRHVMPALVIGYEGAAAPAAAPAWMQTIEHQHGGYSCLQTVVSGCVLRLDANQDQGTGKLWLLTRALVELGEMWPHDAVYGAPEVAELKAQLSELVSSPDGGDEIGEQAARQLAELVATHLAFPGLTPPRVASGTEALLRFEPFEPLPFFENWRIACACRCGDTIVAVPDCARYGADTQAALLACYGKPPGVFLLWENVD